MDSGITITSHSVAGVWQFWAASCENVHGNNIPDRNVNKEN